MFKVLVVLVTVVGSWCAFGAAVAADSAALRAAGANVSVSRCTLAKMATAADSKCERVATSSLSASERGGVDHALSLVGGGGTSPACIFWIGSGNNGFSCANGSKVCACVNDSGGPQCGCSK
jgi:hypothetical protein